MGKSYSNLEKKIGVKFKNINLLKQATTHKSFNANENYEKLEFLGDRVLGLIISKKLLELYPKEKEGSLDKKLASLVNKNKCFEIGCNVGLENHLMIGNTKKNFITAKKKIVSDAIEAIIGAIYLDAGINEAEIFILKNWSDLIVKSQETQIDSKTQLQEYSLKKFKTLPTYKLVSNTGPRHNPTFRVAVKLKNSKFIEGAGPSKKSAEQDAAANILKSIKNELAR